MSHLVPSSQQRTIVDHPLEPLRVEAGAGTGKTTTVALRIARLVDAHGLDPEQVLGITFTNKAAAELADRVRATLGDRLPPGRDVEVHTYHGFAAQLLREFGMLVGVERDAPVITPTFGRQLLSEVVRRVPLPRLDATYARLVEQIRSFASALGDHLIDPERVDESSDDPDDPAYARADLLRAVRAYQVEKRRLGVCDYGDLILRAHELVVNHPWVAERVRQRYRAVVLDEYQDTNPAQRMLLQRLFGDGFPVTAVGDPDQTIYEWRGASLANFAQFPEHFPLPDGRPAATLPLSLNRRSGPLILDVANAIRLRVDDRERTSLSAPSGTPPGEVFTRWEATAVSEAEWIGDRILALHQEGYPWRAMAVLFRKNKDIALVADALTRRDIPVEVANLGGLLTIPEVVDLHCWLRVLDRPDDGTALVRLLRGSRFRLGAADIRPLTRWMEQARRSDGLRDDDHDPLPARSLLEALDHLDEVDGLRPSALRALQQFTEEHRTLLEAAQGVSLVELCRRVLDVTGAWRDLEAMGDASRLSARLNLYRFLDLAEEWSPLEGRPSLTAFLDYLEALDDEPNEELDTARLADADAVTLLTVHRAKGLEWPVVFLPCLYQDNFPSRVVGTYDNPYRRPEYPPFEWRLDRESLPPITPEMPEEEQKELLRRRHESQEWRLAYVAATRAKEKLHVSGAWWYGQPEPRLKPVKPSPLFQLIEQHPDSVSLGSCLEAPERPPTLGYRYDPHPAPDPLFPRGWGEALLAAFADPGWPIEQAHQRGLAQPYHEAVAEYEQLLLDIPQPPQLPEETRRDTSVTGLVTYAACPRRFYWSEVDRLPRRHSPAARRGVDVHRRIELHHRGVVPLEDATEDSYDLVASEAETTVKGDPFRVFSESRFASLRPHLVEAPFELRLLPDLWVRGRIDAVYQPQPGVWEVVDFKSGRPTDSPVARVQLQAYGLAVHEVPFPEAPPLQTTVTFAYLGEGLTEVSETVDPVWLRDARTQLEQLAEGIYEERWDPQPSDACRGCDFLRFCPEGRDAVG